MVGKMFQTYQISHAISESTLPSLLHNANRSWKCSTTFYGLFQRSPFIFRKNRWIYQFRFVCSSIYVYHTFSPWTLHLINKFLCKSYSSLWNNIQWPNQITFFFYSNNDMNADTFVIWCINCINLAIHVLIDMKTGCIVLYCKCDLINISVGRECVHVSMFTW